MTDYEQLIYSIKNKLDRFNRIFKEAPLDNKDYDTMLECYAEDIYEMCRKFYKSNEVSM